MIVILGATGKTGSAIGEALIEKGKKIRVIGRDAAKLKGFVAKGADAAIGDLGDRLFLSKAFAGAGSVYALIPPNFGTPDFRAYQKQTGESIIAALKGSSVKNVVHLSSQGAHLLAGTGPITGLHDQEERLNGLDGVNVLHLRPTYFMENLLVNISLIQKMGIMGSAVRGDFRFAMIATKDIAEYAAARMVKRDFAGKTVRDLLGQRDISLDEAAAVIGRKLGMPGLRYAAFPYEDAEKAMIGMGITPDLSRLYIEMSKALNDGRFAVGIPRAPENTTATPIEEFAGLFAQVYNAAGGGKRQVA